MRAQDKAGYICLAITLGFYLIEGADSTLGRLFNGAALGFFLHSIYTQLSERK